MMKTAGSAELYQITGRHIMEDSYHHSHRRQLQILNDSNQWRNKEYLQLRELRVQLKCAGTRWRTGEEVKWKLANGVLFTLPRNMVYPALLPLVRTSRLASSRLNWRPRRFKWTRPFHRKTKSGNYACAITFQTRSTPNEIVFSMSSTKQQKNNNSQIQVEYL